MNLKIAFGALAGLSLVSTLAALAGDLAGAWQAEFDTQIGKQKYRYQLKVDGGKITGQAEADINGEKHSSEIKEGRVAGDDVTFVESLEFQGNPLRITYAGKLSGDELKLTRKVGDFAAEELVAKRSGPAPGAAPTRPGQEWGGLSRYFDDNAKLPPPAPGENRVVFLGDSITDAWAGSFGKLFPGKPYVGRGISGQTTPQMLVRFRQDVVNLKPKVVIILAGTNDTAGNTGPSTDDMIEDNLRSMVELAKANGIRPVLCSILPVYDFPWKKGLAPATRILRLNRWIHDYAAANGIPFVDYHTPMADERMGLKAELSGDGVHPNDAGYALMAPLAEQGIAAALASR